jgi:hypothetical protein
MESITIVTYQIRYVALVLKGNRSGRDQLSRASLKILTTFSHDAIIFRAYMKETKYELVWVCYHLKFIDRDCFCWQRQSLAQELV